MVDKTPGDKSRQQGGREGRTNALRYSYLSDGAEMISGESLTAPLGSGTMSLSQRIQLAIQHERMRAAAEAEGYETFAEADDFNLPDEDDIEPWSAYEMEEEFGPAESPPPTSTSDADAEKRPDQPAPQEPPMPSEAAEPSDSGAGEQSGQD